MKNLAQTFVSVGGYEMSLATLFKGITPESKAIESTLIRSYINFKKTNILPDFYSVDELVELFHSNNNTRNPIWFCTQLLENAIKFDARLIENCPLNIDELILIKYNTEKTHKFMLNYFQFVELIDFNSDENCFDYFGSEEEY